MLGSFIQMYKDVGLYISICNLLCGFSNVLSFGFSVNFRKKRILDFLRSLLSLGGIVLSIQRTLFYANTGSPVIRG